RPDLQCRRPNSRRRGEGHPGLSRPGGRAGAHLPPGRRGSEHDARGAGSWIREFRRRGPVRRGAVLPIGPGWSTDRPPRAAQRLGAKSPGRFVDPVVSSVYEPGSVFKMITAVAALSKGVVKPSTKINDSGTLQLDGGRAHVSDADLRARGWMPFEDIVAYSRN